jgi:hypothetical protein
MDKLQAATLHPPQREEAQSLIGQTISHYRIAGKAGRLWYGRCPQNTSEVIPINNFREAGQGFFFVGLGFSVWM